MKRHILETTSPFQGLPELVAYDEGLFEKEGILVEWADRDEAGIKTTDTSVTDAKRADPFVSHGTLLEQGKADMYNACEWGNYCRTGATAIGSRQIVRRPVRPNRRFNWSTSTCRPAPTQRRYSRSHAARGSAPHACGRAGARAGRLRRHRRRDPPRRRRLSVKADTAGGRIYRRRTDRHSGALPGRAAERIARPCGHGREQARGRCLARRARRALAPARRPRPVAVHLFRCGEYADLSKSQVQALRYRRDFADCKIQLRGGRLEHTPRARHSRVHRLHKAHPDRVNYGHLGPASTHNLLARKL